VTNPPLRALAVPGAPVAHVNRSSRSFGNPADMTGVDWVLVAALLAGAAAIRAIFFTGFFGSDEVTYVDAATSAANGVWPNSTYIGAIRLGVNLPIAAAIAIFGPTVAAVSSWAFICSVLEVGVVYWFARRAMGRPLAVVASLLLAVLPLHVHLAGRIMADPPLALFITTTFVVLFEAQRRQSDRLYLLAGLCAGLTFWIKEAALIFVGVPVLWAVVRRDALRGWAWFFGGLLALVAGNFAAMWLLSGNPLHLVGADGASD
jgi:4-amino-4-deoxy-L-arabinose transferase-like glycosyltransferase